MFYTASLTSIHLSLFKQYQSCFSSVYSLVNLLCFPAPSALPSSDKYCSRPQTWVAITDHCQCWCLWAGKREQLKRKCKPIFFLYLTYFIKWQNSDSIIWISNLYNFLYLTIFFCVLLLVIWIILIHWYKLKMNMVHFENNIILIPIFKIYQYMLKMAWGKKNYSYLISITFW